ncbi:MAG: methylisocitrate lyase [Proteobacteria bacterium]|nr:MAG: methylisocitrate lyase [Pseudomonadota bacterium]
MSQGKKFRDAVTANHPLQIVGTINAYHALLATHSGFEALYLSGGGVAAGSLGLPDLGISTLDDILTDTRRITDVCSTPLLVDIDTGFGSFFNIQRTIKSLIKFEAAACHIEDQVQAKRCGHRPNKAIVSQDEMVDRLKACVDARTDDKFVIMARTDAIANEGIEKAIERMQAYVNAGADMIFAEAVTNLAIYKQIKQYINVPILANITEFGMTPLYTAQELASVDVDMILYPLSAFRAMNAAALKVYTAIKNDGSQKNVISEMQSRDDLYKHLNYYAFEDKLDVLLKE